MPEEKTIEQVTKSYEEKIAQREKEFIAEKEQMKKDFEKEKQTLEEQHNKDIAEIIRGRKTIEEIQNKDKENDEKSFFDTEVEKTKKILGITKGEK